MNTSNSPRKAKFWVLIPCAGSGSRTGLTIPKQYKTIANCPLIMHTLAAFAHMPELAGILLVLAPDDNIFETLKFFNFLDMGQRSFIHYPFVYVEKCGGETRAQSVENGLKILDLFGLSENDWVLVHDAARCLITDQQIRHLMRSCENDEIGGLLAQPLADTLKQAWKTPVNQENNSDHSNQNDEYRIDRTLDRSDKWLAQTPQMFRFGVLQQAVQYDKEMNEKTGKRATDEASAIEAIGCSPLLIDSQGINLKVTYLADFELAEIILNERLRIKDLDTE